MTEYMLQKRTLSHWSYVTWYDDLEQAKRNFDTASKEGNGYSWRLVELTVLEQKLNEGELKDEPDGEEALETPTDPVKTGWGATPVAGGWGKPLNYNPSPAKDIIHGSVGSVWLGNPTTKEKKRVPAVEAAAMMANGWIKTGPRTVL